MLVEACVLNSTFVAESSVPRPSSVTIGDPILSSSSVTFLDAGDGTGTSGSFGGMVLPLKGGDESADGILVEVAVA